MEEWIRCPSLWVDLLYKVYYIHVYSYNHAPNLAISITKIETI